MNEASQEDIGERTEMIFRDINFDKSLSNGRMVSVGEVLTPKGSAKIEVRSNYQISSQDGRVYGYSQIRAGGGHDPFRGVEVRLVDKNNGTGRSVEEIREEIHRQCYYAIEQDIKDGSYPE